MICRPFDVVVVPFPFTDAASAKRRPALVVSRHEPFNAGSGCCVLAMITSEKNPPWPLDAPIKDLSSAGLEAASKVRMKLFTLDTRLILRKAGRLSPRDGKAVASALKRLLAC